MYFLILNTTLTEQKLALNVRHVVLCESFLKTRKQIVAECREKVKTKDFQCEKQQHRKRSQISHVPIGQSNSFVGWPISFLASLNRGGWPYQVSV